MRTKYFTQEVKPILTAADAGLNAAYSDGDLLFDWTAFVVPHGARLIGAHVEIRPKGDSGSTLNEFPLELIFMNHKQEHTTGAAFDIPRTLGAENAAPTTPASITTATDMFLGQVTIVAGDFRSMDSLACASTSDTNGIVFANRQNFNNQNVKGTSSYGEGKFYVAGIAGGAFNFVSSTLINNGDLDGPTMTVDGVDPRLHIAIGDTVAACDTTETETEIKMGVVEGMTATSIILTQAFTTTDVANNDIVYNTSPIRILLTMEY